MWLGSTCHHDHSLPVCAGWPSGEPWDGCHRAGAIVSQPAELPPRSPSCRKGNGCSWLRPPSSPGVAQPWPLLSVAANVHPELWLLIAFPICQASLGPMAAQAGKNIMGVNHFFFCGLCSKGEFSSGFSWERKPVSSTWNSNAVRSCQASIFS